MSLRKEIKAYFTFSGKDRAGSLILVSLILAIYFLPYFYHGKLPEVVPLTDTVVLAGVDSLMEREQKSNGYHNTYKLADKTQLFKQNQPFYFDPNTLDSAGWQQLGLLPKTIQTIIRYRSKGGQFRKAEDLEKIWGLPNGFYDHVKEHIRIETETVVNKNEVANNKTKRNEYKIDVMSFNTADSTALIKLPGIGPRLAARIVQFRNKLGGFHSVEQLSEIYGLPDSTFQKIKNYIQIDPSLVQKIDINSATKDALRSHPYIKWNLANAIVEYRNQHGLYTSIGDLKNIALIDEITFKKLQPYLVIK